MKSKEYLQQHSKELEFDFDLKESWDNIESELEQPNRYKTALFSITGIVILIIGVFHFYYKSTDKSNDIKYQKPITEKTDQQFYANLKSTQTAERIFAISEISNQDIDQKTVDALLFTLKNDESIHVKIATVRAMENLIHYESTRVALIQELVATQHTYLKIKIINILTRQNVKHVIPTLDDIIKDESNSGLLQSEASQSKATLLAIEI